MPYRLNAAALASIAGSLHSLRDLNLAGEWCLLQHSSKGICCIQAVLPASMFCIR